MILFRRIPPDGGRVVWGDDGIPQPSSQNFRDRIDELSTYLAHETSVENAIAGHEGFGLVQLSVQDVRDVFHEFSAVAVICRDDENPANGHVLICGKITKGMAKRLSDRAKWVSGRLPKRVEPPI